MKTALSLLIVLFVTSLWAEEPVKTRDHSCSDLQEIVEERGEVYIKLRISRYYVYSAAYVRNNRNVCFFDEDIVENWVPSEDKFSCHMGYRCQARR